MNLGEGRNPICGQWRVHTKKSTRAKLSQAQMAKNPRESFEEDCPRESSLEMISLQNLACVRDGEYENWRVVSNPPIWVK